MQRGIALCHGRGTDGHSVFVIALAAVLWLPDGFSRDLDYNEHLG